MLIPVTFGSQRVWVDLAIGYDKYIYVNSEDELGRYVLTNAWVDEVLSDADVIPDIARSMATLTRDGTPREDAIKWISSAYGIPIRFVRDICTDGVDATAPV